jgi:hypothetical protein
VIASVAHEGEAETRAQGRVDLTDGGQTYMLYRVPSSSGMTWVMVDDEDYKVSPLDRESFERALLSLLG